MYVYYLAVSRVCSLLGDANHRVERPRAGGESGGQRQVRHADRARGGGNGRKNHPEVRNLLLLVMLLLVVVIVYRCRCRRV